MMTDAMHDSVCTLLEVSFATWTGRLLARLQSTAYMHRYCLSAFQADRVLYMPCACARCKTSTGSGSTVHSSAWQQTPVVHQIMPQDGSPVVRVVYNVVDFQC